MERIDAVVIGAGQAGLAASHELSARGIEHVVLERGVVGHTWRTRRWRSFRLVSPNSLNLLPGLRIRRSRAGRIPRHDGPARPPRVIGQVVRRSRADRHRRRRRSSVGGRGYRVKMDGAELEADNVEVATGAFGNPSVPAIAANLAPEIHSIHASDYWAPEGLHAGGVLVVGAGQSGLQIADELARDGRSVVVAVGRHGWAPRRVYGQDQMRWRWNNGDYRSVVADPDRPKTDYPFTFLARWGTEDFNVRTAWLSGVSLAGHLVGVDGTRVTFAPDLTALLRMGDGVARDFIRRIRDFARGRGEAVAEPKLESHWREAELSSVSAPTALDLTSEGQHRHLVDGLSAGLLVDPSARCPRFERRAVPASGRLPGSRHLLRRPPPDVGGGKRHPARLRLGGEERCRAHPAIGPIVNERRDLVS